MYPGQLLQDKCFFAVIDELARFDKSYYFFAHEEIELGKVKNGKMRHWDKFDC